MKHVLSVIQPHTKCCYTQINFEPESPDDGRPVTFVLPCNSDETVHAAIGLPANHGLDHEGILRAWVADLWKQHPQHGSKPLPDFDIPEHPEHEEHQ